MRIRSVRIALALGLLCAIGAFFACTTTPENGNRTPTNQNQAVNANRDQSALAPITDACEEPDLGNRRTEVETTLTNAFGAWPRDHWNLKVQAVDNKNLRILIGGAIGNPDLAALDTSVKQLMQPGCVISVYFVKKATVASAANTVDTKPPYIPLEDFRWGGCEGDLQMCPDGSCNTTCPKPMPQMSPTPGTKGVTNLNADANKSNSNSNSNRAP
jgi:hypothetical protein